MNPARKAAFVSSILAGLYAVWFLVTMKNSGPDGKFNLMIFIAVFSIYEVVGIVNFFRSGYRTNGPYDGLVPPSPEHKRELEGTYQLFYMSSKVYASFVTSSLLSFVLGFEFREESLFALGGWILTSFTMKIFIAERKSVFRAIAIEEGLNAICEFRVNKILNSQ